MAESAVGRIQVMPGCRAGRLIVGSRAGRNKWGVPLWSCVCDCGTHCVVGQHALARGSTKSCGCLQRGVRVTAGKKNATHGLTGTSIHDIWVNMHARCRNKKHPSYKYYGERGIRVCDRWASFENFYSDMGDRPSLKHSVDRRENNKGYEPGNCYWATKKEQQNNMRNNFKILHEGCNLSVAQWAEKLGINVKTVWSRLARGWKPVDAITKKVRCRNG